MSNKIGYGNPPEKTRFPKGKSGNPKGRPLGSKNTYKLLDDLLQQKVVIMQDGKPVHISKKVAILLQAVNTAVKGDLKAIQGIFPHLLAVDAQEEKKKERLSSMKKEDQEILKNFFKEHENV